MFKKERFDQRSEVEEAPRDHLACEEMVARAVDVLEDRVLKLNRANLRRVGTDVSAMDPTKLRLSDLAELIVQYEVQADYARTERNQLIAELDAKRMKVIESISAEIYRSIA